MWVPRWAIYRIPKMPSVKWKSPKSLVPNSKAIWRVFRCLSTSSRDATSCTCLSAMGWRPSLWLSSVACWRVRQFGAITRRRHALRGDYANSPSHCDRLPRFFDPVALLQLRKHVLARRCVKDACWHACCHFKGVTLVAYGRHVAASCEMRKWSLWGSYGHWTVLHYCH